MSAATPSAILYFKNDSDEDLVITRFLIGVRKNVTTVSENHVRGIMGEFDWGLTLPNSWGKAVACFRCVEG